MFRVSVLSMLLLFSNNLWAKEFSNGFIKFELPSGWECVIEGSEWVCQSNNADRKKEAIIILAAKKRGAQDELGEYRKYLKQAKTYSLPGAKTQISEPKSVKTTNINGLPWVDALHMASEVPGFFTRYLATVKADIGVAVTFSVTKNMYGAYKDIFDSVIKSMRIFRQTNIKLAGVGKGRKSNTGADMEGVVFEAADDMANIGAANVKKRKGEDDGSEDMILFLVLAGVVGFVVMKMKKGKGGKGKKKKKA